MISRRSFVHGAGKILLMAAVLPAEMAVRKAFAAEGPKTLRVFSYAEGGYVTVETVEKSPEEWKKILTPEEFHILREKGTERAYSGDLWNNKEKGIYRCAGCQLDLFSSEHKYDSGTGWPSFWKPIAPENVATEDDWSFFIRRTEVHCARCGGHQGHIFKDGPEPTGLRYCINSASLDFVPLTELEG